MSYGTTLETREKLGKCLKRCASSQDSCLARYLEAHRPEAKPEEPPPAPPPPKPAPPPAAEPAPVERTATKGSELGPAVDKVPEPYPATPQGKRAARDAGR